ncbi:hypothetical protein ACH4U7_47190 [Streptomyces sp. NPDC020845]|uniref:hypothetical protein n=1 Tax=Streptomyces sp. NPDC020845 TaxID=3365096 RepID=UPI0037B5498F
MAAEVGTVRIRIADSGAPPGAPARAVSRPGPRTGSGDAGHGLVGIRQRAAMYGGSVTIGPRETGHGWLMDVVLDVPTPRSTDFSAPFDRQRPRPSASGEQLP